MPGMARGGTGTDAAGHPAPAARRFELAGVLLAAVVAGTLLFLGRSRVVEDAYITYRHAQNLLLGRGFVFNPGEAVLATTSPGHGLLLALLGLISPNIPLNALLISWCALVACSIALYRISKHAGVPVAGAVSSAMLLCYSGTYSNYSLETLLLTALLLLSFHMAQLKRWAPLACYGAAAMVVRADAALLLGVVHGALLISAVREKRHAELRAQLYSVLLGAALVSPWFVFSLLKYGSLFSHTASAKTGWTNHEMYFLSQLWDRCGGTIVPRQLFASVASVILATLGFARCWFVPERRFLLLLPAWAAVYVATYTAMRIFWPHTWYYYPLYAVLCLGFALGLDALRSLLAHGVRALGRSPSRAKAVAWGTSATLLTALLSLHLVNLARSDAEMTRRWFGEGRRTLYEEFARWLANNPGRCQRIASLEVGMVAYLSDRVMIDRMGLATPAAAAEMKRTQARNTSVIWTQREFSPDCFLIAGSAPLIIPAELGASDRYRLVDPPFVHHESHSALIVYERR